MPPDHNPRSSVIWISLAVYLTSNPINPPAPSRSMLKDRLKLTFPAALRTKLALQAAAGERQVPSLDPRKDASLDSEILDGGVFHRRMLDGSDISLNRQGEGGDLHMTRVKDQGGRTEPPPRISKRGRSNFVSGQGATAYRPRNLMSRHGPIHL